MKNFKKSSYRLFFVFFLFAVSCSTMQKPGEQPTRLTEPRLQPLEEIEWNQTQAQMLTPLKKYFKDGRVINIFTTMARHPKLFASWMPFGTHFKPQDV